MNAKKVTKKVKSVEKRKKANKVQMLERLHIICSLLLEEYSTRDIVRISAEKWGVKRRQVEKYIRAAYTLIKMDMQTKRKAGVGYRLAKRYDLYNKAYQRDNLNLCLQIEQDIARLEGAYGAEVLDKIVIELKAGPTISADIIKQKIEQSRETVKDDAENNQEKNGK